MSSASPPEQAELAPAVAAPHEEARQEEAVDLVRGSSLLLVARVMAQAAEFGLQLFFVRYLTKSDYGALAYAISIIFLLRSVALWELPVTLARFLPLYREQRHYGAMLGSVLLGVGLVAGFGVAIALVIDAGLLVFGFEPTDDQRALLVLAILVAVVPVQALDILLTSLFATFASPRAIFIRQGIVGPGLKIALAVTVIATDADLVQVALGFIAVELLSLLVYGLMFLAVLKRQPQLGGLKRGELAFPVRKTLAFATPLLTGTLVWVLMETSDAILLGYFHSTQEVAAFRAVLVVALLNQGVTFTFALLYTPILARLYARGDHAGLKAFYWRSTLWVQVLSFPVFVLTFSFASATTVGVVGDRYADSAAIMALLALGFFFHSSLGFNGLTLRVFGKLRYSVSIDIVAAAVNVLVNLLLIPRWGAVGAAVGTAGTMVLHNALKQYGLWRYTGINLFERSYLPVFLGLFGVAAGLLALQAVISADLVVAIAVTLVVALALLWITRRSLEIEKMFPEIARWPVMRALVQTSRSR